jgi:hypothetical protein
VQPVAYVGQGAVHIYNYHRFKRSHQKLGCTVMGSC